MFLVYDYTFYVIYIYLCLVITINNKTNEMIYARTIAVFIIIMSEASYFHTMRSGYWHESTLLCICIKFLMIKFITHDWHSSIILNNWSGFPQLIFIVQLCRIYVVVVLQFDTASHENTFISVQTNAFPLIESYFYILYAPRTENKTELTISRDTRWLYGGTFATLVIQ